ncbi:MAG: hypothetical protein J0649_05020 [Methylococcales bacterium]|jgi:hypothetical protein|nr:hypothetical protein [Methylococcales bacterium]
MKAGWEIKTLGEVCEVFADGDWIESKEHLFETAFAATNKRVVIKSPPLGGKPSESFAGKLLRFDVYFKN